MDSLDREDQKKSLIDLNNRWHFYSFWSILNNWCHFENFYSKTGELFIPRLVSYVEKVRKLQEAADVIDSIPRTAETLVFFLF